MKRLLLVFLLMVLYKTHAQENQDIEDLTDETNNTLEVSGFSVVVERDSDSLSVAIDSLAVEEEKIISRRDSLLFLSFRLPKPGILKNIVLDPDPNNQAAAIATLEQVKTMGDKGMSVDEIMSVLQSTPRSKQAEGGLSYLMGL